jgi:hypothetical protein
MEAHSGLQAVGRLEGQEFGTVRAKLATYIRELQEAGMDELLEKLKSHLALRKTRRWDIPIALQKALLKGEYRNSVRKDSSRQKIMPARLFGVHAQFFWMTLFAHGASRRLQDGCKRISFVMCADELEDDSHSSWSKGESSARCAKT